MSDSNYTFFLYINPEKTNIINNDKLTVIYKNDATNNLLYAFYKLNNWGHLISSQKYELFIEVL